MDKDHIQDQELESSQDTVKNLSTVESVRAVKRDVESQEAFTHNGQGSCTKVPKLGHRTEIDKSQDSQEESCKQLLRYDVRSVREADWNKIKELSDLFDTRKGIWDKNNKERYLLDDLYRHVRGNCGNLSGIYWKKPSFVNCTYPLTLGRKSRVKPPSPKINLKSSSVEKDEENKKR